MARFLLELTVEDIQDEGVVLQCDSVVTRPTHHVFTPTHFKLLYEDEAKKRRYNFPKLSDHTDEREAEYIGACMIRKYWNSTEDDIN
jgi:hypothetical protein